MNFLSVELSAIPTKSPMSTGYLCISDQFWVWQNLHCQFSNIMFFCLVLNFPFFVSILLLVSVFVLLNLVLPVLYSFCSFSCRCFVLLVQLFSSALAFFYRFVYFCRFCAFRFCHPQFSGWDVVENALNFDFK